MLLYTFLDVLIEEGALIKRARYLPDIVSAEALLLLLHFGLKESDSIVTSSSELLSDSISENSSLCLEDREHFDDW